MSILTMAFSSLNKNPAKAFANSVLPTPVLPKKIKEPIGFLGSWRPALLLLTASEMAAIASSWPITLLWSSVSKCSNFSRSLCNILLTGIPVHLLTTSAMSSASTSSFTIGLSPCRPSNSFCKSKTWDSVSLILPYLNSATLPKSPLRSACSASTLYCSIKPLLVWIFSTTSFSLFQRALMPVLTSFKLASSLLSLSNFSWSFSFLMASLSISNCMIFRFNSSNSSGNESISILSFEAASSSKSMALSGRKRSLMYLLESSTALMMASSLMRTLWWTS